jgi:hypothetical protein
MRHMVAQRHRVGHSFGRWRQLGQSDLTRWSWTGLEREYIERIS